MTNYFELYDLAPSFHPDTAVVRNKFYELSRRYHPDRFAQADEATRAEVLRMSALNNDAYKTLNDSDALTSYILRLNGLLEEEEKYSLPPIFLMEMMDLNEIVSDYEMDTADDAMKQQAIDTLQEQFGQWNSEVKPLTGRYDAGEQTPELLLQIKDYYFRKKYLLRIQERINKFATH